MTTFQELRGRAARYGFTLNNGPNKANAYMLRNGDRAMNAA